TPMQEGLLFHYLKEPEGNAYFVRFGLDIHGEVDVDVFRGAWGFVAGSNEMLRTVFRWEGVSQPAQVVLKESRLDLEFYDLSGNEPGAAVRLIDEIKVRERKKNVDLHRPPFRVRLLKKGPARFEMLIYHHHILYDGWSNGILLKEFFSAYEALTQGNTPLGPGKPKYKEFVKYIAGRDRKKQETFWRSYLDGFEGRAGLPSRDAGEGNMPGRYGVSFSKEESGQLELFSRQHKLSLASFWYGAWGILLQKYNHSEEVLFGTTVSGRP
ncbi:MAG: B12-binding domain-containing radical SAM protein, partial [bacterium]|nr:B12-binding domain-containing radical SAM protein [bacterium]